MKKNNIQIAAIQETNLNEKSTLKSRTGYCINTKIGPKKEAKLEW